MFGEPEIFRGTITLKDLVTASSLKKLSRMKVSDEHGPELLQRCFFARVFKNDSSCDFAFDHLESNDVLTVSFVNLVCTDGF